MHIGKRYTPVEFFKWTRRDLCWMIAVAALPTTLFAVGLTFLALPWQPIGIVGTAVAFVVGFKNNASYNRIWEARQIYGAIINDSRSFGYTLRDALKGSEAETIRRMFNLHFAWLTALRFQLREARTWENTKQEGNNEYRREHFEVPEWRSTLEDELKFYLNENDRQHILSKKNSALHLTGMQSDILERLRKSGVINDYQWSQLQHGLSRLTESQGRAERIKNFPYPRNFASIATYLLFIFVVLAPFGLLNEFAALGKGTVMEGFTVWFNVPFTAIVTWAFHTLDKVGESSVNPFEGNANDIPITQMSRMIEIDMREMLNESSLPDPIVPKNNIVL